MVVVVAFFVLSFIWSLFTALHVPIGVNRMMASQVYKEMLCHRYSNDKYLCETNYILPFLHQNNLAIFFPFSHFPEASLSVARAPPKS